MRHLIISFLSTGRGLKMLCLVAVILLLALDRETRTEAPLDRDP